MDGQRLPTMRSGIGAGVEEGASAALGQSHFIRTSLGLLRVFSEEAIKTAGEYAIAQGRSSAVAGDMQKALKYQARMFFQQVRTPIAHA